MSKFSEFRTGVKNVTGRAAVEAELDEELSAYVELLVAENIKAGASPEEARRAALMKVGGIERVKDDVRDVRPGMMIESAGRDLKHGFRLLKRSPGFAAIAIATIALGIGATSAIFSVINAVALKPLPYLAADQLMFISSTFPGLGFDKFWVSPPELFELRERAKSFSDIAAYRDGAVNVADGTRPQRVPAIAMTANMFSTLGVQPRIGRGFTPEEDMPNQNPVVVISDNLWRSTFGSDSSIVGKAVEIQGRQSIVIGVMPKGFDLHDTHADVFTPIGLDPANRQNRGSHFLNLVSRLKPFVTQAQAAAELKTLVHQWASLTPGARVHTPNDTGAFLHLIQLAPLRDEVIGNVAKSLWVLQGAVILVLLIACANVANLLLVRAEGRHKEFAIRTALGAGRGTILRQFMAEGMVLTFVGAVLGLLIAKWGLAALIAANPTSVPRASEIGIDPRVLLFTTVIAVLTATVFGLAPLFHLGEGAVAAAIKEGGTRSTASMTRHRMRQSLVAGEITFAVVLVIGAGLLIKSFHNLTVVDAGFDPQNLTTFSVYMPPPKYPDANRRAQFTQDLMRSLEQLQGVTSVAAMNGLPPNRSVNANDTQFENLATGPGQPAQNVDYWNFASVRYFDTMKIPIIEGRGFNTGEIGGAGAVVVNEALAKRFYPKASALGHRLRPPGQDSMAPWYTIVGVAKDVKQGGLDQKVGTEVYFNVDQVPRLQNDSPRSMTFVMRSSRSTESLANSIQTAVHAIDPTLPVNQLKSMNSVFGDSVSRQRFLSLLLGIFAGVALLLAAIGTYGVLSYLVTERRREIGIRVALGASASGIVKLVLRQGMSITAVGIVLGIGGALALGRVTQSLLFNVSPTDPTTFAIVGFVILGVALLACIVPANRAMRVDPLVAIRNE
ncbi:MAG: ABC transporter permease [Gemmatimonadaceae bacterium]